MQTLWIWYNANKETLGPHIALVGEVGMGNNESQMKVTAEGPDLEKEMRIIALEFAITLPGMGEIELEMFSCKHTIPFYYGIFPRGRVTLHTSHGDITTIMNRLQPGATLQAN